MSKEKEMNKGKHWLVKLNRWIDEHADSLDVSMKCELRNLASNISLDIDVVLTEVKVMCDFCERIEDAAKAREDVTLFGVDYMALPVDSDGMPIHVWDKVEWHDAHGGVEVTCWGTCTATTDATSVHDPDGKAAMTYTVEGVGDGCFFALDTRSGCFVQKNATSYRHHTPDTWERIIEDAVALGALMGRRTTQIDDLVARCKELAKEDA